MPATLDDLRAAVLADPDDDAVRTVLGDALAERGDPRGELYTVQLALARANLRDAAGLARSTVATADPAYAVLAALVRRQHDLLAAMHASEPPSYERGGRVDLALTDDDDPVSRLAELLAAEPIVRLALGGQSLARIPELARVPGIARITALTIDARAVGPLDLAVIGSLLRALPDLRSLALLGMPFDSALLIDSASLHALTARALGPYHLDDLAVSPHARTLTHLRLLDPMADSDPLDALDGRFPRLAEFDLSTSVALRIDPTRQRFLPPTLRLAIHSDPDTRAIAALVARASFAGVRTLAIPGLSRGADVIVATLAGKARDLVEVDVTGSTLERAGIAALAHFPPLERLAISHQGPITDFARVIAALRPRAVELGAATHPAAIERAIRFADDHVRDLTISAPIAALTSTALVRLACEASPADLSTLPNLAELVVTSA